MSGSNRPGQRRQRPLPAGETMFTPGAAPGRASAERRSAAVLVFMHQLPAWVFPVLMAVLLVAGLAVRGPAGAVLLCGVAAVLALLAFVSWPQAGPRSRAGRIVAIACVLALAVWQALR